MGKNSQRRRNSKAHNSPIVAAAQQALNDPDLSEHQREKILVRSVEKHEIFSGPMPHPDDMRAYGDLIPNAGERFMSLWEREQTRRHEREQVEEDLAKADQAASASLAKRGQWLAFVIALCVLVLSVVLAYGGHETLAVAMATLDLATLVGVFLHGGQALRKRESLPEDRQIETE